MPKGRYPEQTRCSRFYRPPPFACVWHSRGTSEQPPKEMSDSSKSRFKKRIFADLEWFLQELEEACQDWAKKTKLPVDVVRNTASCSLLIKHKGVQKFVEDNRDADYIKRGDGAISASVRSLWGHVSSPGVVASTLGMETRRTLLGSISGPKTTYRDARAFLGGNLSLRSFHDAKTRNEETMKNGDLSFL